MASKYAATWSKQKAITLRTEPFTAALKELDKAADTFTLAPTRENVAELSGCIKTARRAAEATAKVASPQRHKKTIGILKQWDVNLAKLQKSVEVAQGRHAKFLVDYKKHRDTVVKGLQILYDNTTAKNAQVAREMMEAFQEWADAQAESTLQSTETQRFMRDISKGIGCAAQIGIELGKGRREAVEKNRDELAGLIKNFQTPGGFDRVVGGVNPNMQMDFKPVVGLPADWKDK